MDPGVALDVRCSVRLMYPPEEGLPDEDELEQQVQVGATEAIRGLCPGRAQIG
jgi:hypothetical protein